MELISRQEAKTQGLKRYFTGKPCLRGHVGERFILNSVCCLCHTEREQTSEVKEQRAARARKPETKAKVLAYEKTSSRRILKAAYEKTSRRKAKQAKARAIWRTANKERMSATHAAYSKANRAAIKAIYEQCAFTSRVTGEKHHVDHFYPLKSDWVCGLHVIENLQVLTATENCSKGNRPLQTVTK